MNTKKLLYRFNDCIIPALSFYRDYVNNFISVEGIAEHYDILETQANRLIDNGRKFHNMTAEIIKNNTVLKTKKLTCDYPLDVQLKIMTGDGYNTQDFVNVLNGDLNAFSGNLIMNKKTRQIIEII